MIDISAITDYRYDKNKNKFLSGGGGLVSTLYDYLKFSQMLLNNGRSQDGKTQIISPKTLKFMTINHLPNNNNNESGMFYIYINIYVLYL